MIRPFFDGRTRTPRRQLPRIELLEGRRLMAARAAASAIRVGEIEYNGAVQLQIIGTARADSVQIQDNGTDSAGNIALKFADGATYTSKKAIASILVMGGAGRDRVSYELTGDLVTSRSINVNLGQGDDVFEGAITGAIVATNATLDLQVFGNQGNDRLSVTQTGENRAGVFFPFLSGDQGDDTLTFGGTGDVKLGATLGPALVGGAGNDTLNARYEGVITGTYLYNLTLIGGAGNDSISNLVFAKAGSFGKLGASSTAPAAVIGGLGDDRITVGVYVDTSTSSLVMNAFASGGAGTDQIQRTANVVVDKTNETDIILADQGTT
jgi:hypothetical protein